MGDVVDRKSRRSTAAVAWAVLAVLFAAYLAAYFFGADVAYGIGGPSGYAVATVGHPVPPGPATVIMRSFRWPLRAEFFLPIGALEAKLTRRMVVLDNDSFSGSGAFVEHLFTP